MKRRTLLSGIGLTLADWPLSVWAQPAAGLRQIGLSIGNNNYKDAAQLVNSVRDAQLMHKTFQQLGAQSELSLNLSSSEMNGAITAFIKKMQQQTVDIAWFFFSGHGAEVDGRDLLLGTDISLQSAAALKTSGFNLDRLKGLLSQIKPRVAIVIVDACRNNPFLTRSLEKKTKGMVPQAWDGMLVAYSTAEYTKALDWPQKANGPYATALSACLTENKSRGIEEAFKAASDQVFAQTGREQTPGYYSELRSLVWLDAKKVSLKPLPDIPVAAPASAQHHQSRSVMPAAYRADLQLDDQYMGTDPGTWANLQYRIETMVTGMDRFEAKQALKQAQSKSASDRDLCIAGLLLEQGHPQQGVEKNRILATQFYTRAAVRGYVPAQTLLGEVAYLRQDYVTAYKWLSVASQAGYGRATIDLAQMTAEGAGVEQDPQKAAEMLLNSFKSIPEFSGKLNH